MLEFGLMIYRFPAAEEFWSLMHFSFNDAPNVLYWKWSFLAISYFDHR